MSELNKNELFYESRVYNDVDYSLFSQNNNLSTDESEFKNSPFSNKYFAQSINKMIDDKILDFKLTEEELENSKLNHKARLIMLSNKIIDCLKNRFNISDKAQERILADLQIALSKGDLIPFTIIDNAETPSCLFDSLYMETEEFKMYTKSDLNDFFQQLNVYYYKEFISKCVDDDLLDENKKDLLKNKYLTLFEEFVFNRNKFYNINTGQIKDKGVYLLMKLFYFKEPTDFMTIFVKDFFSFFLNYKNLFSEDLFKKSKRWDLTVGSSDRLEDIVILPFVDDYTVSMLHTIKENSYSNSIETLPDSVTIRDYILKPANIYFKKCILLDSLSDENNKKQFMNAVEKIIDLYIENLFYMKNKEYPLLMKKDTIRKNYEVNVVIMNKKLDPFTEKNIRLITLLNNLSDNVDLVFTYDKENSKNNISSVGINIWNCVEMRNIKEKNDENIEQKIPALNFIKIFKLSRLGMIMSVGLADLFNLNIEDSVVEPIGLNNIINVNLNDCLLRNYLSLFSVYSLIETSAAITSLDLKKSCKTKNKKIEYSKFEFDKHKKIIEKIEYNPMKFIIDNLEESVNTPYTVHTASGYCKTGKNRMRIEHFYSINNKAFIDEFKRTDDLNEMKKVGFNIYGESLIKFIIDIYKEIKGRLKNESLLTKNLMINKVRNNFKEYLCILMSNGVGERLSDKKFVKNLLYKYSYGTENIRSIFFYLFINHELYASSICKYSGVYITKEEIKNVEKKYSSRRTITENDIINMYKSPFYIFLKDDIKNMFCQIIDVSSPLDIDTLAYFYQTTLKGDQIRNNNFYLLNNRNVLEIYNLFKNDKYTLKINKNKDKKVSVRI